MAAKNDSSQLIEVARDLAALTVRVTELAASEAAPITLNAAALGTTTRGLERLVHARLIDGYKVGRELHVLRTDYLAYLETVKVIARADRTERKAMPPTPPRDHIDAKLDRAMGIAQLSEPMT